MVFDPRFSEEANDKADIPAVNGFLRVEFEDAEVVSDMVAPVVVTHATQTSLRTTRVDLTLS